MNKIKKVVILIIVILIALIMLIGFINIKNSKQQTETETQNQSGMDDNYDNVIKALDDRSDYFLIKTCMNMYLQTLNTENSAYYGIDDNGNIEKQVEDEYIYGRIYNLLSKRYIEDNKITKTNVTKYINTLKNSDNFVSLDIKCISNTENNSDKNIVSYAVYGLAVDTTTYTTEQKLGVLINIDKDNLLFSVEPLKLKENSINNVKISEDLTDINQNDDNIFTYPTLTNEDICREYINLYKFVALSETDLMYSKLDSEYCKKKFESEEEYKKYIQNNRERIISTRLDKYKVNEYENYTQYICIDQSGNYYIFNETSPMQYTVMLDAYTVDLPEFTDKYNSSDSSQKVALNIEKIREAINDKDYKYVYGKLDNTFKNNYYPTQDSMAQYLSTNLFTNNKFESTNTEQQNDTYIFTINITDGSETDTTSKNMKIVMKLGEGTDFVMSFSMQ